MRKSVLFDGSELLIYNEICMLYELKVPYFRPFSIIAKFVRYIKRKFVYLHATISNTTLVLRK